MNIQDKMQEIHHKYGVTERANYEIQLFVDDLIKKDRAEQLNLCAVNSCLTLKEVASKYGEKVKCMFYDYDDNWKEKTMIVDSSFLKDMEKGVIKDCC
jgi:hypothetical protein